MRIPSKAPLLLLHTPRPREFHGFNVGALQSALWEEGVPVWKWMGTHGHPHLHYRQLSHITKRQQKDFFWLLNKHPSQCKPRQWFNPMLCHTSPLAVKSFAGQLLPWSKEYWWGEWHQESFTYHSWKAHSWAWFCSILPRLQPHPEHKQTGQWCCSWGWVWKQAALAETNCSWCSSNLTLCFFLPLWWSKREEAVWAETTSCYDSPHATCFCRVGMLCSP